MKGEEIKGNEWRRSRENVGSVRENYGRKKIERGSREN